MIESFEGSNWPDEAEADLPQGYSFYNNTVELFFDPGPHVYYRYDEDYNRINVAGVTTVLNVINKPYLKAWAAKLAVEYIREQLVQSDGTLKQLSTEEFNVLLQEAKGQYKVRLDIAGNIGHLVHNCLEKTIQYAIKFSVCGSVGSIVDLPVNEMAASCVYHAIKWMKNHNVKWLFTESKVYSKYFDYAGTTDGVAYVDSCDDIDCCRGRKFTNRRSLIDWKSSNQLDNSYAYQAAAYLNALTEEYGQSIEDRWVLWLGKQSGDFEPWYLPYDQLEADFNAFKAALYLYRSLNEITERRRKEDAELREIKKATRDAEKAATKAKKRLERQQAKEVSKQATKARVGAAKDKYKQLRESGMSVAEAKQQMKKESV